ncbi:MAG TPA: NHLP leader peptide family RiPP precursor [Stellaceae bacterium]|nr:NHLP leader peptide family RiPP precursor [Stellaceae bacterium]
MTIPADQTGTPFTRQDIEAKIVAHAWQDEEFRRKFLADPKGQFEEKLGVKLPVNLKITAHQEDENHLHFVIPVKRSANVDELSDQDLENVAGGVEPGALRTIAPNLTVPTVVGSPLIPPVGPW